MRERIVLKGENCTSWTKPELDDEMTGNFTGTSGQWVVSHPSWRTWVFYIHFERAQILNLLKDSFLYNLHMALSGLYISNILSTAQHLKKISLNRTRWWSCAITAESTLAVYSSFIDTGCSWAVFSVSKRVLLLLLKTISLIC